MRRAPSQVVTYAPDGSQGTYLGSLGHVAQLKYSFACPGGADQMSCTLFTSARYRHAAMNPGRIVQVIRGSGAVWDGKLDDAVYTPGAGWGILAHGAGTFGSDYDAVYTTWANNPDDAVNQAITRGLRWVNPGIGSPSGLWLGQKADSGSQTITDLLNLATQKGGLTWYVSSRPQGNVLSVFPLPLSSAVPSRVLVSNDPVGRTLGGDVNVVWLRYLIDQDAQGPAVYGLTSATEPASIARHQRMEEYADLSSAGLRTAGQAQAIGASILQRYQRAFFSGSFAVSYGQLLTTGGQPVDLGCEQAGMLVRLIATDYDFGGEITMYPVNFLAGAYAYDDDTCTATVTPFQSLATSFSSLLGVSIAALPHRGGHGPDWRQDLKARQDAIQAARREARQDARQRAEWMKHHPRRLHHHRHPPNF